MGRSHLSVFLEPSGGLLPVAHSRVRMTADLQLVVQVEATLRKSDWPIGERALNLNGWGRLLGLQAAFTFHSHRGRTQGTADELSETRVLFPPGFAVPIPAQRIPLGSLDSCDLWVSGPGVTPGARDSAEYHVGRCNGSPVMLERFVRSQATLLASFTPKVEPNGGAIEIEVTGELRFERNLNLALRLMDPEPGVGRRPESAEHEATVLAAGCRVPIPHMSVRSTASNPWISVRIIEGSARLVYERLLGRCVHIK